jgi:hypothetical protein
MGWAGSWAPSTSLPDPFQGNRGGCMTTIPRGITPQGVVVMGHEE